MQLSTSSSRSSQPTGIGLKDFKTAKSSDPSGNVILRSGKCCWRVLAFSHEKDGSEVWPETENI